MRDLGDFFYVFGQFHVEIMAKIMPKSSENRSNMEPKPSKRRSKIVKNGGLGGSGGARDGAGGHLGTKVPKVMKNMVRCPPPADPFGDHFGTQSDKIQKKGLPAGRLGRKSRIQ